MKFYALLGEAHDQYYKHFNVATIRIIRVQSSTGEQHVKPNEAFFPYEPEQDDDDIEVPDDVFFRQRGCLQRRAVGASKKNARSFLEAAGIRIYDEKAETERILETYRNGKRFSVKRNKSHVRQFIAYWQENKTRANLFSDVAFLRSAEIDVKSAYCKPCDLYMDQPYADTELDALFNDETLTIERPKKRISDDYQTIKGITEFANAIGVMRQLEICAYLATEMQKDVFVKCGRSTNTATDEDYFINGFHWRREQSKYFVGNFYLSVNQTALSCATWVTMCGADPKVLTAQYIPNKQRRAEAKTKSDSSFLVKYLTKHEWIPDREGNFHTPADITKETLHPDFVYDDRNGWLTAIGFGKNAKEQSEEYQRLNAGVQEIGFGSVDEAKEIAKIVKELGVDAVRALAAQRKAPRCPKNP
jgi:hypothetical protein